MQWLRETCRNLVHAGHSILIPPGISPSGLRQIIQGAINPRLLKKKLQGRK